MTINIVRTTTLLFLAIMASSCGSDDASKQWRVTEGEGGTTTYGQDSTVIVTNDSEVIISGNGDGCADISKDVCIDPNQVKEDECGDANAQADIIVVDGQIVEVICYPPNDEGTPIEEIALDGEGNADIPQNESGTVVIFPEATNGESIPGDITLTAERVSLFGNGVDNTILEGNLIFSSNGSQVRGVTVQGNVTIDGISNNASLTFCRVHGNLEVIGNGVTVANCTVFGNLVVTGNNTKLVNIGVQGNWEVNSYELCSGCYSFDDADDDFVVHPDEMGDGLCAN